MGFVASIPFIRSAELTRTLVQAHVKATNTMRDNPKIAVETTIKQFNMSPEVAEASAKKFCSSRPIAAMAFSDKIRSRRIPGRI